MNMKINNIFYLCPKVDVSYSGVTVVQCQFLIKTVVAVVQLEAMGLCFIQHKEVTLGKPKSRLSCP